MKNVYLLLIAVLMLCGCGNYYGHVIESDYSFDGNFSRYDSYDFIADRNFEGSGLHKELIEQYLDQTLTNWGYEQKQKRPSLLIFYKLYYDDFQMKGYQQPNFEQWVNQKYSGNLVASALAEPVDEGDSTITNFDPFTEGGSWNTDDATYDPVLCDLREGTLLISFYDRKLKKTIWQGYASGIFGNDRFDNSRFVRHIVYRIMDKYRVLADSRSSNS